MSNLSIGINFGTDIGSSEAIPTVDEPEVPNIETELKNKKNIQDIQARLEKLNKSLTVEKKD